MLAPPIRHRPIHQAHVSLHARFTDFAGHQLPASYGDGQSSEHLWTRTQAGLFDISHMGQATLSLARPTGAPSADHHALASALETVVSGDIRSLRPGEQRYSLILNESGGIVDRIMVARIGRHGSLHLVVSAATQTSVFRLLQRALEGVATVRSRHGHTFLAIEGPGACDALSHVLPTAGRLAYMRCSLVSFGPVRLFLFRSGCTGEDGFEMLIPAEGALPIWLQLLEDKRVRPIGLDARESLRLEAGVPLVGSELDESTSPIEAGLGFAVCKQRLAAGNVRGAARFTAESCRVAFKGFSAALKFVGPPLHRAVLWWRRVSQSATSPVAAILLAARCPYRWLTCRQGWPNREPSLTSSLGCAGIPRRWSTCPSSRDARTLMARAFDPRALHTRQARPARFDGTNGSST
jgi:aminomethyltransferase